MPPPPPPKIPLTSTAVLPGGRAVKLPQRVLQKWDESTTAGKRPVSPSSRATPARTSPTEQGDIDRDYLSGNGSAPTYKAPAAMPPASPTKCAPPSNRMPPIQKRVSPYERQKEDAAAASPPKSVMGDVVNSNMVTNDLDGDSSRSAMRAFSECLRVNIVADVTVLLLGHASAPKVSDEAPVRRVKIKGVTVGSFLMSKKVKDEDNCQRFDGVHSSSPASSLQSRVDAKSTRHIPPKTASVELIADSAVSIRKLVTLVKRAFNFMPTAPNGGRGTLVFAAHSGALVESALNSGEGTKSTPTCGLSDFLSSLDEIKETADLRSTLAEIASGRKISLQQSAAEWCRGDGSRSLVTSSSPSPRPVSEIAARPGSTPVNYYALVERSGTVELVPSVAVGRGVPDVLQEGSCVPLAETRLLLDYLLPNATQNKHFPTEGQKEHAKLNGSKGQVGEAEVYTEPLILYWVDADPTASQQQHQIVYRSLGSPSSPPGSFPTRFLAGRDSSPAAMQAASRPVYEPMDYCSSPSQSRPAFEYKYTSPERPPQGSSEVVAEQKLASSPLLWSPPPPHYIQSSVPPPTFAAPTATVTPATPVPRLQRVPPDETAASEGTPLPAPSSQPQDGTQSRRKVFHAASVSSSRRGSDYANSATGVPLPVRTPASRNNDLQGYKGGDGDPTLYTASEWPQHHTSKIRAEATLQRDNAHISPSDNYEYHHNQQQSGIPTSSQSAASRRPGSDFVDPYGSPHQSMVLHPTGASRAASSNVAPSDYHSPSSVSQLQRERDALQRELLRLHRENNYKQSVGGSSVYLSENSEARPYVGADFSTKDDYDDGIYVAPSHIH